MRSFIKLTPITAVTPGSERDLPGKRRFWRPRATKKMMVTMDRPFVWPEVPAQEELKTKFDAERYKKLSDDRERQMQGAPDVNKVDNERRSIAAVSYTHLTLPTKRIV